MRLKRSLALVAAAIALLAVAAAAVLWVGARTPPARRMVAGWVSDAIGLPATIASLRLGFFPRPALEIGGLRIAQPEGFGDKPLAEIARARVTMPWQVVWGGQEIGDVSILGARLRLQVAPNGDANWSRLFPAPAAEHGAAGGAPGPAPAWSLGRFALESGAVEYEDRSEDTRWQLTAITLSATDVIPASTFPVELRLGGVFGENTIHYAVKGNGRLDPRAGRYEVSALEFEGWAGGEPMPLAGVELEGVMARATYESATGVAMLDRGRLTLAGIPADFGATVDFDEPRLAATFRLDTGVFPPRPTANAFGYPLPATADPDAWQAAQLSIRGRMHEGVLQFDPVTGRLDATRFEGRVVPARRLVRAQIDRIDLNRYLRAATRGASTRQKKETLEEAIADLAQYDLDAEIRVGEARVGGARIRDAVIRVERDGE